MTVAVGSTSRGTGVFFATVGMDHVVLLVWYVVEPQVGTCDSMYHKESSSVLP